jgi:hypothetical protein
MSSSSHGLQKVLGPVQLWGIAVGLVISGEYPTELALLPSRRLT